MKVKKRILKVLGAAVLPVLLAGAASAEGPAVSGFIDFGYNYNFNGMTANRLRGFDATSNSLSVQNAKLAVSGKSDQNVGWQVDVIYGRDGELTKSAGWNTGVGGDQIDLEQAFVSFECPVTHGTVTVGKFVTMHGAEVIEAKDNFNTSRGLLFNYAIPFTHTGIKYSKGFMEDKLSLSGGVVNGWDNMRDNNKGKSLMAQAGYTVSPKVSVTVGGMTGPEQAPVTTFTIDTNADGIPDAGPVTTSMEKNSRNLIDAIVKVVPSDKLTLVANYDWGVEEGAAFTPKDASDTTANWSGLALHAKYMLNTTWAVAGRYENFGDEGSRTGTRQSLNSYTGTLEHTMNGVITRLEYRGDMSNKKVFVDDKGAADDSQNTVSVQVIFPF